jgi:hypothetical protein
MSKQAERPYRCPSCHDPIEHPTAGRPRRTCRQAACLRWAAAERKADRRRRQAGLPVKGNWTARFSGGGRDSLARRAARRLAASCFEHVQPTEAELEALEAAARAGAVWYTLGDLLSGKSRRWRAPADATPLDPAARRVLKRLQARNRAADPEYTPRQARPRGPRGPRPGGGYRFREEATASASDAKARGNAFGQLLELVPKRRRESVFRALALTLHPDVGGDAELMKLLNTAYESVTGTPSRRR